MNNIMVYFPDGTECKVESISFNDLEIDIPASECISKPLENLNVSFEMKLIDCNYKLLKKLFKYPRKLKKKLFGTKRQRRKSCIL